jgi:hypothetical protein
MVNEGVEPGGVVVPPPVPPLVPPDPDEPPEDDPVVDPDPLAPPVPDPEPPLAPVPLPEPVPEPLPELEPAPDPADDPLPDPSPVPEPEPDPAPDPDPEPLPVPPPEPFVTLKPYQLPVCGWPVAASTSLARICGDVALVGGVTLNWNVVPVADRDWSATSSPFQSISSVYCDAEPSSRIDPDSSPCGPLPPTWNVASTCGGSFVPLRSRRGSRVWTAAAVHSGARRLRTRGLLER